MNTTTPRTEQQRVPNIPYCEEYIEIPSKSNPTLETCSCFSLSGKDKAEIFRLLGDRFGRTMKGDYDGEEAEIVYKAYIIYATREYQAREVRGGDSYCGICERYTDILRDHIKVTLVANDDGIEFEGVKASLNDFAKLHNL